MFTRDFLYTFKIIFRAKTTLFWTLVFPLCLTVFMYMAFGNLMDRDEMFHNIPVAVVTGDGAQASEEDASGNADVQVNVSGMIGDIGAQADVEDAAVSVSEGYTDEARAAGVTAMLDALSEGDDALLSVTYMTEEEALAALDDEDVAGVIYADEVKLVAAENSVNASILESVLSQYKQYEYAITDIYADSGMEAGKEYIADGITDAVESGAGALFDETDIQSLAESFSSGASYYTERGSTEGSQDVYNNYFYAIFAMSCLFASLSSLSMMNKLQANVSASGMRKCVSPAPKMKFILAELAALWVIHFVVEVIAMLFMYALGVKLGDRVPGIILTLALGCAIGLALGVIVGVRPKPAPGTKVGILCGISMALCILADLCMQGIKHQIQLHAPIINKINPAALITDSLYALGVYSDYEVFTENIIILAVETAILLTIGIIMAGRNRYENV